MTKLENCFACNKPLKYKYEKFSGLCVECNFRLEDGLKEVYQRESCIQ